MSGRARERMLNEAIRKHDLAFGTDHCDQKYILSCSELPGLILQTQRPPISTEAHCPTCTCGRRAPVQYSRDGGEKHGVKYGPHGAGTIAWAEHEEAWAVYGAKYGSEQSAEVIARRGGFGYGELVDFLRREPTTWRAAR